MGAEVLNKAIPFLLLPIITKYLTPTEYGIYGIYQVLLSFLSPFLMMSFGIHITRNFFKVSKEEMSKIISSIIFLLHIHLFAGLIILYIVSLLFNNPLGIPSNTLLIMPLIIFAQTINTFNLTLLRNKEMPIKYGIIQISITFLNFTSVILMLIFFHLGWRSLVYGLLIAHLVVAVFSLYQIKKEYLLSFDFYSLKQIYKISLPLIFHLLGGSIIFLSDRIFIQQLLGIQEVGFYTLATQFGMIGMIVINSIIMAINPWMYKKLANNDQDIVKYSYGLMLIFFSIGIILFLVIKLIFPYIVDNRYHVEYMYTVIFWLLIAFVIRGWYQIFYNFVLDLGKTNIFMYITSLAGGLNILLNYFFINIYGVVGAALATTIAFLFMFISTYIYVFKTSKLKFLKGVK